MGDPAPNEGIRLDQWLWAARFFKTRSLAAAAVTGGKVAIDGDRAKPSRSVRPGNILCVRRGAYEWTVVVKDVSRRRGPAPQAQLLYEETEASRLKRETISAQMRLEHSPAFDSTGRPSKKDRRDIARFKKQEW